MTAEHFASVNDEAAAAESMVGGVSGKLIRGISWLSLNNEAIAKAIETALGVAARKATEKLSWCLYACTDPNARRFVRVPAFPGTGRRRSYSSSIPDSAVRCRRLRDAPGASAAPSFVSETSGNFTSVGHNDGRFSPN